MLSVIWDLLPSNVKVTLGVGILSVVLITSSIFIYQSNKIGNLEKEIVTCKVEQQYKKAIYDSEIEKALKTIKDQSDAINKFKLDGITYIDTIKEKEKELLKLNSISQKNIETELLKDNSPQNQLQIITNMLTKFSSEYHEN